jgi:hypothetical protein
MIFGENENVLADFVAGKYYKEYFAHSILEKVLEYFHTKKKETR